MDKTISIILLILITIIVIIILEIRYGKKEKKEVEKVPEKDEFQHLKEKVNKLKEYGKEIKLREKIYKIYDVFNNIDNGTIDISSNLVVEIKQVDDGFHLTFNKKTFKFFKVTRSGTLPDNEYYNTSTFSLYDVDNNLIFQFETFVDDGKEWFEYGTVRMGEILTFKNGDWIFDISRLHKNIIGEEITESSEKRRILDIDRMKKNFNE